MTAAISTTAIQKAEAEITRRMPEAQARAERCAVERGFRYDISTSQPVFVIRYIGDGKLTMGMYASATLAKQMVPEVGRWVLRDSDWHSEDGRTVIEPTHKRPAS